ncbi:hypothetical protein V8C44DRAFT_164604 [Trichoderma aethiopicum]
MSFASWAAKRASSLDLFCLLLEASQHDDGPVFGQEQGGSRYSVRASPPHPGGPTLDRQHARRVELAEAIEFVAGGSGTGSCGRGLQARRQSYAGAFDLLARFADASSRKAKESGGETALGEWKQ